MGKYRDIADLGPSRRARYIPDAVRRHFHRKGVALKDEEWFRAWCEEWGFTLEIKNEGHHWKISGGKNVFEWWPSSAKLVINQTWDKGIHCHDVVLLSKVIEGGA